MVAETYERFRPGYPDEVVDRTVRYADRPVRTAVEVGAGTGKATRAFASRGIDVTAVEPDPEMFSVLERETLGMPVTPVRSTYEEYDGPPADLLYAAAAMHWTAPETRWTHAADLLVPGGAAAVFGAEMRLADDAVRSDYERARSPFLPDDTYPHEPLEGVEESGCSPTSPRRCCRATCSCRSASSSATCPPCRPTSSCRSPGASRRWPGSPTRCPTRCGSTSPCTCTSPAGCEPAAAGTGQSARSTMTGAWSLAPVPPRSSRSISAPVTRAANAGEPSTKSMRMPRFRSKRCR